MDIQGCYYVMVGYVVLSPWFYQRLLYSVSDLCSSSKEVMPFFDRGSGRLYRHVRFHGFLGANMLNFPFAEHRFLYLFTWTDVPFRGVKQHNAYCLNWSVFILLSRGILPTTCQWKEEKWERHTISRSNSFVYLLGGKNSH